MMFIQKQFRAVVVTWVLLAGVVVGGSFALAAAPLMAQARGPVQRVAKGTVLGADGVAVKGAVVYLKDTRTGSVKSAIADDSGNYRFVQLSQGTDYEVYAKVGDKTSKTRSISSFDTKNEFTINLKID